MPEFMWAFLAAFIVAASVGFMVFAGAVVFLGWKHLRIREIESTSFAVNPGPRTVPEPAEEEADPTRVWALAQNHQQRVLDEWKDEMREQGWDEDQIDNHLASRPLLELN